MTAELETAGAAWQNAIEQRDVTAAGEILHPDYALVLVHPRPASIGREDWLRTLPDYVVHEYRVDQQQIDVDGDSAAVLAQVYQGATVFGADRSGTFILSDVWRLVDGRWLVWRRHSTPLQAGVMPSR